MAITATRPPPPTPPSGPRPATHRRPTPSSPSCTWPTRPTPASACCPPTASSCPGAASPSASTTSGCASTTAGTSRPAPTSPRPAQRCAAQRDERHAFAVRARDGAAVLSRPRNPGRSAREALDVVVLQDEVLGPAGVDEAAIREGGLAYTRSLDEVDRAVAAGEAVLGFGVNPATTGGDDRRRRRRRGDAPEVDLLLPQGADRPGALAAVAVPRVRGRRSAAVATLPPALGSHRGRGPWLGGHFLPAGWIDLADAGDLRIRAALASDLLSRRGFLGSLGLALLCAACGTPSARGARLRRRRERSTTPCTATATCQQPAHPRGALQRLSSAYDGTWKGRWINPQRRRPRRAVRHRPGDARRHHRHAG